MIIFYTDMDRTMIYSKNVDIKSKKVCVEIYKGEEYSFMTEKEYEKLHKLKDEILIVPTTTRSVSIYKDINLGYVPKYALASNGGVLLVDGEIDEKWYKESQDIIKNAKSEISKAKAIAEDKNVIIKESDGLFLAIRPEDTNEFTKILERELDLDKVIIYTNKIKVYVVPKNMTKGDAIKRFREKMLSNGHSIFKTISAGDSDMDTSMFEQTDISFAPTSLVEKHSLKNTVKAGENEELLENFIKYLEEEVNSKK